MIIGAVHATSPTRAVLVAALATRTAIVAIVLIGGLRLFGKRELGQLNIYDLAMLAALANAVQNAMTQGSGYLAAGLASAASLLVLAAVLAMAGRRSGRVERLVEGSPTLLAFDGRAIRQHMRAEGVTTEQLEAAVREHGLAGLDEVLAATLEVDGSISIVDRSTEHRRHARALAAAFWSPRSPVSHVEGGRAKARAAVARAYRRR